MESYCQINLYRPPDGTYQPGDTVSGVIEYGVDEETVFSNITISLKGIGFAQIVKVDNDDDETTYRNMEVYVDIDYVDDDEKKTSHEIGMYKRRFNFQLPKNIPSSVRCNGYDARNRTDKVSGRIEYYIRIKFERPGFAKFTKRFKKELTVVSGIKPELPIQPTIYGTQKKILSLFLKDRIINVKATIDKSVVSPGGKIELHYEVCNSTNLIIKEFKVKLIEVYTVRTSGLEATITNSVYNTTTRMESLKSGETLNFDIIIDVPFNESTLGFSTIISRDYFVAHKVVLPFPYINASLLIPVEIGDVIQEVKGVQELIVYEDPPPSYWEVMDEVIKDY